jgi:alpha-tubulin suppressor-like RCC1 family protein
VYGLSNVEEVALGGGHGCARLLGGDVRCWGDNSMGELDLPDRERSLIPVAVAVGRAAALAGAGQLAFGHSCAVIADGHIRCWGRNDHGQLGRGVQGPAARPADVTWHDDDSPVSSIARPSL